MRRVLLVGGLLITFLLVVPGSATAAGCYVENARFQGSQVSNPGPHAIGPGEVVELASDLDGAKIQMAVIRPEEVAQSPVIVFASPYLDQNLNEGCNVNPGVTQLVENYVPHGYAVGVVAVRGTADSGGCSDLMGPAERADLNQAITWFGTQSWSTGAVGMMGVSYDGSTPWEVAAAGNPYLKTIIPISGVNDLWHLMYRNGTPELRGAGLLNTVYWIAGWAETNPAVGNRSPENTAAALVCRTALEGFATSAHATATGERDPLGWWAERNSRPGVEANYRGSILLVHGLQDWNVDPGHSYPWAGVLESKGILVHHLLPQWGHAYPDSDHPDNQRLDWADIMLEWFDRHLKGLPVDLGRRVQVQDSMLRWRDADSWPPAEALRKRFFLTPDNGASEKEPATESSEPVIIDPGPSVSATCPTCAAWSTPARESWRITGLPVLRLSVTPSGPGGHIAATLSAGGRRLGWGQVDLRFPDGAETAQPVVPGQRMTVTLPIEPLDAVVPEDEQLVIRLSQGTYGDHLPNAPVPLQVHAGKDSWLDVPELPDPPPCSFFLPPGAALPDDPLPTPPEARRGSCPRSAPPAKGPATPATEPAPFSSRLTRTGRRLRGTAVGPIARVEVAFARKQGRHCRHLSGRRLGAPRPCSRRVWKTAKGTTRWKLDLPRLPRGHYVVAWRAVSTDGRAERVRSRRIKLR